MTDLHPPRPLDSADLAEAVHGVARRHGFSTDAVDQLWAALVRGGGRMAQFDHPEFGGAGQWMQGGMTMVSSMFEGRLQRRVADLCDELAAVLHRAGGPDAVDAFPGDAVDAAAPAGQEAGAAGRGAPREASGTPGPAGRSAGPSRDVWWPVGLGRPASSGAQNGMRYAWFPEARRLVVEEDGRRAVYDTGEHRIDGVSQQQGGTAGLAFASQHGPLDLARLPVVPEPPDRSRGTPAASGAVPAPASGQRQSQSQRQIPAPEPRAEAADTGVGRPTRVDGPPPRTGAAHGMPTAEAGPGTPGTGAPSAVRPPAEAAAGPSHDPDRILGLLEKLADLQARGILTAEEFAAKKAELLGRL